MDGRSKRKYDHRRKAQRRRILKLLDGIRVSSKLKWKKGPKPLNMMDRGLRPKEEHQKK
jgi:hypothetical protein